MKKYLIYENEMNNLRSFMAGLIADYSAAEGHIAHTPGQDRVRGALKRDTERARSMQAALRFISTRTMTAYIWSTWIIIAFMFFFIGYLVGAL
jgi:hypothetical protein